MALADSHASCSDHRIVASAVRTTGDVEAFVRCAAQFVMEHGTQEARRAFSEDDSWRHGSMYVFVDGIARSGEKSLTYVFPPDPSREGSVWGESIDSFGTDYFSEVYRMMAVVDSGWIYYAFRNPLTGRDEPKSSYVIEIDWNGNRAAIGAGIYALDLPGACHSDEVNASALAAQPSDEKLQEFVRCAAMVVESEGYFAKGELENDSRWSSGSAYVFVMDTMGNQLLTGSKTRVNGISLHEWGGRSLPTDQFRGRDMARIGDTFGEAFIYYQGHDPKTGGKRPKVGFLKRVIARGVPVLVGAGYHVTPDRTVATETCADNFIVAGSIKSRRDIQAFVECAWEYAIEHGPEEARRAFHEDPRWRQGQFYVFAHSIAPSGLESVVHVLPPDPSREGNTWGTPLIDDFGTDLYFELHRILAMVDSTWLHYSVLNPASGSTEPKTSYVKEIDWNGQRVMIGAGIYERDLPGTCDSGYVNAANLEAYPSTEKLQGFLSCAAMQVESMGFFAGPSLSRAPRWNSGSIYVFGVDATTGEVKFSGSESSFQVSGRIPEALFEGRDVFQMLATFGEAFLYYNATNRATGRIEHKVVFSKLVLAQGVPLVVGSGFHPDSVSTSQ